jgi:hypothetical protein
LNADQSLDLAFLISERLKDERAVFSGTKLAQLSATAAE